MKQEFIYKKKKQNKQILIFASPIVANTQESAFQIILKMFDRKQIILLHQ